jgi:hypothetical protein
MGNAALVGDTGKKMVGFAFLQINCKSAQTTLGEHISLISLILKYLFHFGNKKPRIN